MSNIFTKANLMTSTILLAFYSLALTFLTFVLVKVNKTKKVTDRCSINLMLVCLMLSAMSKFIFSIFMISFYLFKACLLLIRLIFGHISEETALLNKIPKS